MKLIAAGVASLVVLVAAFLLLPRLLLNVSGNNSHNQNVPVGESRPAGAAQAAGTAAPGSSTRRFVDFTQLQSMAGFTPLTPSTLPGDYRPWEQFVKRDSNPPIVMLSYFKPDGLFIQIYERQHNADDRSFFRGGFAPGEGRGQGGRPANSPFIDVGGTQGLYALGTFGPGNRQMADAAAPSPRNTQPHRVLQIKNNIEIIVEADLTDVPRDELVQIAAGLH
ncbi:MAG TPA: hypothetical protein VH916_07365 [Dehalococcoidia bacterium]